MTKFLFFILLLIFSFFASIKPTYGAMCAAEYIPGSNILTYATITIRVSNTISSHEYEAMLTKTGSSTSLYTSRREAADDNEVVTFEIPLSEYPVEAGDYTLSVRDIHDGSCSFSQNKTLTINSASENRCPVFTGYKPFPALISDVITLEFNRAGQNASKDFIVQINGGSEYVLRAHVTKLTLQKFPVGTYSFTVSSSPGRNDCPDGLFDVSPPECRRDGQNCDDQNPCCAGFTCGGGTEYTLDTCRPQSQLSPIEVPPITPPCEGGHCNTAVGVFNVGNVGKFISQVFQLVLAVGGAGAVLLVIYAGFLLLISRGDKEHISSARQILTAAIGGLIFILLSLAILNLIASNVFNLPGF